MTSILSEVGKQISRRWLTSVLLPGVLLLAATATGLSLGHRHALDADRLAAAATRCGEALRTQPARILLGVAFGLLAAGLLGTAAAGLGALVERLWLHLGPTVAPALVRARLRRARRSAERHDVVPVEAYLPERPTWMGDRVRLIEKRVRAQYWFSASAAWPRIWLLATAETRQPLAAARIRFDDATRLAGWATLYLVLGTRWWPALTAGVCMWLLAWSRGRHSIDEFATLTESAVDVHHRALAEALGVGRAGERLTKLDGQVIDDLLRKGG